MNQERYHFVNMAFEGNKNNCPPPSFREDWNALPERFAEGGIFLFIEVIMKKIKNVMLTLSGETKTIDEWAKYFDMSAERLIHILELYDTFISFGVLKEDIFNKIGEFLKIYEMFKAGGVIESIVLGTYLYFDKNPDQSLFSDWLSAIQKVLKIENLRKKYPILR